MFKKQISTSDSMESNIEDYCSPDNVIPISSVGIIEKNEDLEDFRQDMPVVYTNENGYKVMGSLFSYEKRVNTKTNKLSTYLTILPIEKKYLDRLDRGEELPICRYEDPKGKLEKIKVSPKSVRRMKIDAMINYGQDSEAYIYLESVLDRIQEMIKNRRTTLLIKLPSKIETIRIKEKEDSVDILSMLSREENPKKRQQLIQDVKKYGYINNKKTNSGELHKKVVKFEKKKYPTVELTPQVDGFHIQQQIFYYNELKNKIEKGTFVHKDTFNDKYIIADPINPNSVTKKILTKNVEFEHLSAKYLDLLKFVKREVEAPVKEEKKNITGREKVVTPPQLKLEKSTEEKIDDLFAKGFEKNQFDSEKIYQDFKQTVKSKSDFQMFFDRSEKLMSKFKHSMLFELTLDYEKKSLEQIRERLDGMKNYTKKDMKHFLNQLAKLAWVDNFNKDFTNRFEGEDLQKGISTQVRKKCAKLFNKYIEGKHGADQAIKYWDTNKTWLFNQVSIIKQSMTIKKVAEKEEKKSIWKRGWTKVKGWFGR